jgi:hypothetical protein
MNVFILNTGRCGSTSIIEACRHIGNYSADHESRHGLLGDARFAYPDHHIEADNRLSWLLGRLDRAYGDNARYIHLQRAPEKVAASHVQRYSHGIIKAYRQGIIRGLDEQADPFEVSMDYCDTVTENIRCFLKDKTHTMEFHLEHAERDFRRMWEFIGAEGDLQAAVAAMLQPHNATRKNKRYKKYSLDWWRQRAGVID